MTSAERALAVSSAAAHDLNDDLTIILNAAALSLEAVGKEHPARMLLIELQNAAKRCEWKTQGLLNYAARRGARPGNVRMEGLILEAQEPIFDARQQRASR